MSDWNCTRDDATVNGSSDHRINGASLFRMGASEHGGTPDLTDGQSDLMVAEPKVQVKRPPKYKVILLNDDYTPMDFVVMVLEQIFHKPHTDALHVMLEVHQKGAGLAGVYTRDVAETKVDQVIEYARLNDYPLQCTLEQESP